MTLSTPFHVLEEMPFARAIAESNWLFPTIETLHVLALAIVVGSIAMFDLRLLGVLYRKDAVTHLAADLLPWTWTAFAAAAATGALMFSARATDYWANEFFKIKLGLLVAAGVNMAAFHLFTWPSATDWDRSVSPPLAARTAGLLSLLLWVGVVTCGRWIGFT